MMIEHISRNLAQSVSTPQDIWDEAVVRYFREKKAYDDHDREIFQPACQIIEELAGAHPGFAFEVPIAPDRTVSCKLPANDLHAWDDQPWAARYAAAHREVLLQFFARNEAAYEKVEFEKIHDESCRLGGVALVAEENLMGLAAPDFEGLALKCTIALEEDRERADWRASVRADAMRLRKDASVPE